MLLTSCSVVVLLNCNTYSEVEQNNSSCLCSSRAVSLDSFTFFIFTLFKMNQSGLLHLVWSICVEVKISIHTPNKQSGCDRLQQGCIFTVYYYVHYPDMCKCFIGWQ